MEKEIVVKNPMTNGKCFAFADGSERSACNLRSSYVGAGTYQPGWRWSIHAGGPGGYSSQNHIGYVLSGSLTVQTADGELAVVGPGEAFEVAPGHDAWVNGDEPCVALDFGCNRNHAQA